MYTESWGFVELYRVVMYTESWGFVELYRVVMYTESCFYSALGVYRVI